MNIDEKAILEWIGFEEASSGFWYYPQDNDPDGRKVDTWENVLVLIYSLDWQAKYLWPKLTAVGVFPKIQVLDDETCVFLEDYKNAKQIKSSLPRFDLDIPTKIATHKDTATAVLLAVMEVIKK